MLTAVAILIKLVPVRRVSFVIGCLLAACPDAGAQIAPVPTPESHLGFKPGADFHLAPWGQVVSYFEKVDAASDRVTLRVLGQTTEGRPYLAAFISSADTISNLERFRLFQEQLHDPRKIPGAAERARAVADSKPVVVITCSIHSTETASTLMAVELLHELATRDDPSTREILDKTILILVPSANPDGVEKVARWYERSMGKPWEGSGMPELYHVYAGHDTNRDWFMLNLKETQLLTHLLYKEWFPTVLYDVHQMGNRGARMFVPPFFDPVNPNISAKLQQEILLIGAHLSNDLAGAGKRGVLTNAMYDDWQNGGNRTTAQRHNIVAILTEAASVRLASPIFQSKEELRGGIRGLTEYRQSVNFPDPWPGGWWRLRDIVDYELIIARSLITLAARYRESFQRNLQAIASEAVNAGTTTPPFAWVVPPDQRDPGAAVALVRILHDSGIEIQKAGAPFQAAGLNFPAGSWVLPAAQPYRTHLKDVLERQVYPSRLGAGGRPEPPYDVAGWTLPLQMGVRVVEVPAEFSSSVQKLERIEPPAGMVDRAPGQNGEPALYRIENRSNDDFIVRNALLDAGVELHLIVKADDGKAGAILFRAGEKAKNVLNAVSPTVSTHVVGLAAKLPDPRWKTETIARKRIAVYQPWVSSMDEGWTRFVLEKYKIPYTTVHNAEIRAGSLKERFDSLLIPSIAAQVLREGYAAEATEPAFVGGLGAEGALALRAFVRAGGRLVALDAACEYAIDELNLPVKSVLKDLPTTVFYVPSSLLHAELADVNKLTYGAPDELSVFFDKSLAFDLPAGSNAKVALRYAKSNPLDSGWLLGAARIEGKAALVEAPLGQGSVILFGFAPQHRAQTYATFRLLFNALLN
jgi:Zinc carboxypeptidase